MSLFNELRKLKISESKTPKIEKILSFQYYSTGLSRIFEQKSQIRGKNLVRESEFIFTQSDHLLIISIREQFNKQCFIFTFGVVLHIRNIFELKLFTANIFRQSFRLVITFSAICLMWLKILGKLISNSF
jgi:hypothetical protein